MADVEQFSSTKEDANDVQLLIVKEETHTQYIRWSLLLTIVTVTFISCGIAFFQLLQSRQEKIVDNLPKSGFIDGDNDITVDTLFQTFINDYNKTYQTNEERLYRRTIFKSNLFIINQRNELEYSAGGSSVHGITFATDLTLQEFQSRFLNFIPPQRPTAILRNQTDIFEYTRHRSDVYGDDIKLLQRSTSSSVSYRDWTGIYTTPIKNQGNCGCCWAFSAVEQVESDVIRVLGGPWTPQSTVLSIQQLVDCDSKNQGCNGGRMSDAYDYIVRNGIVADTSYPYASIDTGAKGTCSVSGNPVIRIFKSNWFNFDYPRQYGVVEARITNYVLATGPLSVGLDGLMWGFYTGGGLFNLCSPSFQLNHAAQIVGVNLVSVYASKHYWIVRNSWGVSWGNDGYIYLPHGSNACGLATYPSFSVPILPAKIDSTPAPSSRPITLSEFTTLFPSVEPTTASTSTPTAALTSTGLPTIDTASSKSESPVSRAPTTALPSIDSGATKSETPTSVQSTPSPSTVTGGQSSLAPELAAAPGSRKPSSEPSVEPSVVPSLAPTSVPLTVSTIPAAVSGRLGRKRSPDLLRSVLRRKRDSRDIALPQPP